MRPAGGAGPLARSLRALARVIQFRSELAILVTLAAGAAAGAAARSVLAPAGGPPAVLAIPPDAARPLPPHRPEPDAPALPEPGPRQVVGAQ